MMAKADQLSALRRAERKGKAEGKIEGKAEMAHEAICMYLEVRFGDASQGLQQQIKKIRELEVLDKIINKYTRPIRWKKHGP